MKFFIGDMRNFNHTTSYDYIFNLFTSFGYFNTIEENLDVLKCIHRQLKKNGHLLVDFLNPEVIRNNNLTLKKNELMTSILKLKKIFLEILLKKKFKLRME